MKKSNFPDPGIEAASPALAGRFPTSSAPGNACCKPTFIDTEAAIEMGVVFLPSFPALCSLPPLKYALNYFPILDILPPSIKVPVKT